MANNPNQDPFDFGPDFPDASEESDELREAFEQLLGSAARPINWRELSPEDAEEEWLALNAWVNWLRHDYGLPAAIVPPDWHRHPELVWEFSALHVAWLSSYDPQAAAGAALTWHRDFQTARDRLREWVAASGTRLDRDYPTRQTPWPGEPDPGPRTERMIINRDEDFTEFVREDVKRRGESADD